MLGLVIPAFTSIVMEVLPQAVTALGMGIVNGIANFVGALAPVAMGRMIGVTGRINGWVQSRKESWRISS